MAKSTGKRRTNKRATQKSIIPTVSSEDVSNIAGLAPKENLHNYAARSLKEYGEYVVQQRAIPDFRDNLKPVHRSILWAMVGLGLNPRSPFKKCARVVGETLGCYHPHSDMSIFDSLVGMVNSPVQLIEGYGDFGDHYNRSGSSRYVECRISKFSADVLLDPDYLAAVPYIPNYSDDKTIPLYLPAKLPMPLLIGNLGIAFGVAAGMPSFALEGVLQLATRAIELTTGVSDIPITPEECADTLQFKFPFGGTCVSDRSDIVNFMLTGKGTLHYMPSTQTVVVNGRHRYKILSACPGFQSRLSVDKTLDEISNTKGVSTVADSSDINGTCYSVVLNKMNPDQAEEVFQLIDRILTKREAYDMGFTHRKEDSVKFFRCNIPSLLMAWAKWRVHLEKKVIRNKVAIANTQLSLLKLIKLAVDNLDIVISSLKSKNPQASLMQKLSITAEQADTILDQKLKRLQLIDLTKVVADISSIQADIQVLVADFKSPCNRITSGISAMAMYA